MSIQSTPQSTPQNRAQRSARSFSVRAHLARSWTLGVLCAFTLLFVSGCSGGGGGGKPSPTSETAISATQPIDLLPGQTTAQLAWAPSEGQVVGYLVFQSRGEEDFVFLDQVMEPTIQITGAAGDSIRILVVAMGAANSRSVSSPASPPVRFHPAIEVVAALTVHSAETTRLAAAPEQSTPEVADSEVDSNDVSDYATDDATDDVSDDEATPDSPDAVALLDRALRERLLAADARFPFRALSAGASQWIQSFVDAQVGAGVSLVGSGETGRDALRELVWIDSSGQLFVSEGAQLASSADPSSTFVEGIRLRPTERFVGLADFDGDGVGDWIVEDATTGDIWIVDDESHDTRFAQITAKNPDLRLVGHGDFDGDGRAELLWQHTDSSFQLGGSTGSRTTIEWTRPEADPSDPQDATHTPSQLLAVADLNRDGRDDLLFRSTDGFLESALSLPDSAGLRFEWRGGGETTIHGLELVATLDFDHDGVLEIAWWNGEALELWDGFE